MSFNLKWACALQWQTSWALSIALTLSIKRRYGDLDLSSSRWTAANWLGPRLLVSPKDGDISVSETSFLITVRTADNAHEVCRSNDTGSLQTFRFNLGIRTFSRRFLFVFLCFRIITRVQHLLIENLSY
jgi:hypothetical protein